MCEVPNFVEDQIILRSKNEMTVETGNLWRDRDKVSRLSTVYREMHNT